MGGGSPKNVTQKSELPDILKKPGADYIQQFQNVAAQGIQRTPIYKTVTTRDPRTGRSVQTQQITGYQPADLTQAKAPVYGGQRFADMTADQNTGMGMIRDAAQQNVGDVNTARNQFAGTANGAYMGYSPGQNGYLGATTNVGYNPMLGMNNPYLSQAIDNAQGDVARNCRAMAGELGRISTNMRMQDYGAQ
ncbi:MAG: hypothetical protein EBU85_08205, partial [Actinobacteria bacterium]|nr:hypothetical protein [Actinomycetota bacterium]